MGKGSPGAGECESNEGGVLKSGWEAHERSVVKSTPSSLQCSGCRGKKIFHKKGVSWPRRAEGSDIAGRGPDRVTSSYSLEGIEKVPKIGGVAAGYELEMGHKCSISILWQQGYFQYCAVSSPCATRP